MDKDKKEKSFEELSEYEKQLIMSSLNTVHTKTNEDNKSSFENLYNLQKRNQSDMIRAGMYDDYVDFVTKNNVELPFDHPRLASYHIQQLISEIGEVLDADKRWKNIRNGRYNKDNKLEEIADCFIVLMNIAMFSGYDSQDIIKAIDFKLGIFSERIEKEKGGK